MSQLPACIFGAVAITLSFGAAQLAMEHDLSRDPHPASGSQADAVNRAAKTDRPMGVPLAQVRMQTISLQLNGVPNASVLIRIPVADGERVLPAKPLGSGRGTFACEPVVSVLSEAAKHAPPGRCVT